MKIAGYGLGQVGDLAINMILCRATKELYPDSHLIFGIAKKYESIAPIFSHNPLIDEIKIWEGYDDWPTKNDEEWLKNNPLDIFYRPKPQITDNFWYLSRHHSEEACRMHGLKPPKDLQINFTRYFDLLPQYSDCVAIAAYTSAGAVRDIPEDVSIKIIEFLHSRGLKTIQLGLKSHKQLPTTYPIAGGSIFNDVKIALSCKMLVTADTGLNYLLSGYKANVLGLYSYKCYPVRPILKNRIPINPNADYLESFNIEDIPIEKIFKLIEKKL